MTLGYERLAQVYDALADLYSLGGIRRTQRTATRWIRAGDRVLVAGAGTARELESCALPGVRWTVLDTSSAMLARARRRRTAPTQQVRFVQSRLEQLSAPPLQDVALAPFFLNVFRATEVPVLLSLLLGHLRPGGTLVIADFACGRRWPLLLLQELYYLPPLLLFRLLTKNAWHELYDYPRMVTAAGLPLRLHERRTVSVLGIPLFEACAFTRLEGASGVDP